MARERKELASWAGQSRGWSGASSSDMASDAATEARIDIMVLAAADFFGLDKAQIDSDGNTEAVRGLMRAILDAQRKSLN